MATEKRLIDANAFECVCVNGKSDDFGNGVLYVLDMIDAQPTVDAVEVVHGRWEKHTVPGYDYFGVPALIPIACNCSVCGRDGRNETPYCPNCGADMRGDGK